MRRGGERGRAKLAPDGCAVLIRVSPHDVREALPQHSGRSSPQPSRARGDKAAGGTPRMVGVAVYALPGSAWRNGGGAGAGRPRGDEGGEPVIVPEQVSACMSWLSLHARPRKTVNRRVHSYLLKHEVERWHGRIYIHEDSFIAAASALGYGDGSRGYCMAVCWRNRNRFAGPGETYLVPFEVVPTGVGRL